MVFIIMLRALANLHSKLVHLNSNGYMGLRFYSQASKLWPMSLLSSYF
jgi:hypothetical protein